MEGMEKEQKQRFQLLLQQIGLTDDQVVKYFDQAGIEKLLIDKEKKSWHFIFLIHSVIPVDVFQLFKAQLVNKFSHIASVTFSIKTINQEFTDLDVQGYWPLCVQELDGISPPLLSLLKDQQPTRQGLKLLISTRNEPEAAAIKRKYAHIISDAFQAVGFPAFILETKIDSNEREYEKFIERKQ